MRLVLAFVILTATLSAESYSQKPPEMNSAIQRMVSEVSAANIQVTVEKLAGFGTRHTLSDTVSNERGIGAARRWIKAEFERFAAQSSGRMTVEFHVTMVPSSSRVPNPTKIVNVVATLHPDHRVVPERILLVSGHYDSRASNPMDSRSDAPGANDDGSGTAVVLELARVLSKVPVEATVVFAAFAGEEQGLLGSTAWAVKAAQRNLNIEGVLNNDIVGGIEGGDGSVESTYVRVFSEAYSPVDTGTTFRRRNSLGLENDGPSRSLARYIKETNQQYSVKLGVHLIYRRDRFPRGGDHSPFHERGYAAVRFSVARENYDWQHQNVRTESRRKFGDRVEFTNAEYCANVARVNLATLASLALAPAAPTDVNVLTAELGYGTDLRWKANKEPDLAGYYIRYRDTDKPEWEGRFFTADTTAHLAISKDDYLFGIQAVDREGNASLPVIPAPAR
ncbi:MAG: M28 family peptidase [Bacteroidota bacterium]